MPDRLVVCGIDVGSTNTKVVAIDAEGSIRLRAALPTQRTKDGLIDARLHLRRLEELLLRLAGTGCQVAAMCCAGVGEDGFLASDDLRPLTMVQPWFHPDRTAILADVRARIRDDERLPVRTDSVRSIIGWRWARQQLESESAAVWVALTDWPSVAWTGRPFMSDTLAARTAAWLPSERAWLNERVDVTLGDSSLLPEVLPAGSVVGRVESEVLLEAGVLASDCVAVSGGHDHPLCGWAVQQVDPAAVVDSMGTAEVIVTQSPRLDLRKSRFIDIAPGVLNPEGSSVVAVQELARNVEWASQDASVREAISAVLAGEARPTDDLHGGAFTPGEQGGNEPVFTTVPSTPLAAASSVLGAMAYEGEKRIAEVSATLTSEPHLYATGGWSRSPGWMAIKREVSGRAFELVGESEVTAVAAALVAGHALGWELPARRILAGQTDTQGF